MWSSPLCCIGWEVGDNSASSYLCRNISLFHFPLPNSYDSSMDLQQAYRTFWDTWNTDSLSINSLLACYIRIVECQNFQNFLLNFENMSIFTPVLSGLFWLPAHVREGTILLQYAANHLSAYVVWHQSTTFPCIYISGLYVYLFLYSTYRIFR